jgi:hypothetical protein
VIRSPRVANEGAGPATEGDYFEVAGKPFAMPARVLDASQGWALFFVSTEAANRCAWRGERAISLRSTPAMVGHRLPSSAWIIATATLAYIPEIAVALTVTAKGDPAGQLFASLLGDCRHAGIHQRGGSNRLGVGEDRRAEARSPAMPRIPHGSACPAVAARRCRSGFRASVTVTLAICRPSPSRSAARLCAPKPRDLLGDDDEERERRGNADRRLGRCSN